MSGARLSATARWRLDHEAARVVGLPPHWGEIERLKARTPVLGERGLGVPGNEGTGT